MAFKITSYTKLQFFQYKFLHIILYTDYKLFRSKCVDSPMCTFCNTTEKTTVSSYAWIIHVPLYLNDCWASTVLHFGAANYPSFWCCNYVCWTVYKKTNCVKYLGARLFMHLYFRMASVMYSMSITRRSFYCLSLGVTHSYFFLPVNIHLTGLIIWHHKTLQAYRSFRLVLNTSVAKLSSWTEGFRTNKKICVVPVTYPEKIRVGRSDLMFYFGVFNFIFVRNDFSFCLIVYLK